MPSSRARRRTAARVTPGSSRPSAGGVCTTPLITAKMLARSVSRTSPLPSWMRRCSSGPRSAWSLSMASRRRSSHLCAPMPPGMVTGRSATAGGAGPAGTTSTVTRSGPPAGRAVIRSRPDGCPARQAARSASRPVGRCLPNSRQALSSRRARCPSRSWPRPPQTRSEVNTPVAGRGRSAGGTDPRSAAAGSSPSLAPSARISGSGFQQALTVFGVSIRTGRDPASAAQPHVPGTELEGADRHVQLQPGHRAAVADRPGVDLPRRGFQLVNDLQGPDFRRARDRPRRERRGDQMPVTRAGCLGRERAAHVRDQVPDARVGLGAQQRRHLHAARRADPAEIVAHQVDDHHVLRAVLGRTLQQRTLPRRGRIPRRAGPGALDRLRQHARPGPAQEQLGRQARHRAVWCPDERGIRRVQPGDRTAERVERVPREVRLQPQADVGLENVATADVADRLADRGPVLLRRRDHREAAAGITTRPAAGRVRTPCQLLEPALQRLRAAGRPQRLEHPPAGGPVAAQHMVVEAEPPGGQATRLARSRRNRQERAARAEPQVADPAAAETGTPGPFGKIAEAWQRRVQHLTDLSRRPAYPHRIGSDDVTAAWPSSRTAPRDAGRPAAAAARRPRSAPSQEHD